MLVEQSSSEPLVPSHAAQVHRPFLLDWQDNVLRPIGKVQLVDFQQLAQLPTTDE